MHPRAAGLLIALSALAAPLHAQCGRSVPADSAAVVALEERWLAGPDTATLGRILADDFRHPVASGAVLTKAEHLAWVAAHPRPPGTVARFERLDVRLYGPAAIAIGIVASRHGAESTASRTIFTDVFVCRDGRWQAASAQETPVAPGV